jgi:hypothetical protein
MVEASLALVDRSNKLIRASTQHDCILEGTGGGAQHWKPQAGFLNSVHRAESQVTKQDAVSETGSVSIFESPYLPRRGNTSSFRSDALCSLKSSGQWRASGNPKILNPLNANESARRKLDFTQNVHDEENFLERKRSEISLRSVGHSHSSRHDYSPKEESVSDQRDLK